MRHSVRVGAPVVMIAAVVVFGAAPLALAGNGADDCASATAIGGEGTFPFDNSAATSSLPDNSPTCDDFGGVGFGSDVWFVWTADCDAPVSVDLCGETTIDSKIAVYDTSICPPAEPTLLACNDDSCDLQSQLVFTATSGNSYLIRIGTFPSAPGGTGTFTIVCYPGSGLPCSEPVGCQTPDQQGYGIGGILAAIADANAGIVAAESFTSTDMQAIDTVCWWGVYVDFVTPIDCGPGPGDSFTITYYNDDAGGLVPGSVRAGPFPVVAGKAVTGNVIISNIGPFAEWQFEATHPGVPMMAAECAWIQIANDTSPGDCTWLWSSSPPGDSRAATRVPGDTTGGNNWTTLDYDLGFCVNGTIAPDGCSVVAAPPNDDCADAFPIAGPGVYGYSNFNATTDGPAHAACDEAGQQGIDADVWFCWTSDCDGQIIVTTCGLTGTDSKIAVYDGCACPVGDPELLACNDDDPNCGQRSTLGFNAVAGNQYLIRVGVFPGAIGGPGAIEIICPLVELDPPTEYAAPALPGDYQDSGDLDTSPGADGPGTEDVVVLVPGDTPLDPGAVLIFFNEGTNKMGMWQGLVPADPITVGLEPSGVTVGLFDMDPYLDIAVTNRGDDSVSILINDGDDTGNFTVAQVVEGLNQPSAITVGEFTGDGFVDLAVTNEASGNVVILVNDGNGGFGGGGDGPSIPVGDAPNAIEPLDIDNDKDDDLVVINGGDASATVIENDNGTLTPLADVPVGADPVDVAAGDVDGDGMEDIIVANSGDDTVSVIRNGGAPDDRGGTVFDPQIVLPVGFDPRSVDVGDLNGDGDLDVTVTATDIAMGPGFPRVLQILENRVDAGLGFSLDPPVSFDPLADANYNVTVDLDGDGLLDVATLNDAGGSTSVSVFLSNVNVPCSGDLDGGGTVGFGDILIIIANWGVCPQIGPCAGDVNGDGFVNFADILQVIGQWGPCAGA